MYLKNVASIILIFVWAQSSFSVEKNNHKKRLAPVVVETIINDTTIDDVWDILIDFDNYEYMNDWVKIEGEARVGEVVKVSTIKGSTTLLLEITSIVATGNVREICWDDVTWFTKYGLDGWRCRTIESLPDRNAVKLTNHFEYTGIFGGVLAFFTRNVLKEGMTLENTSLKKIIESN
ncbi:hypothetical protein OAB57_01970 [Bacteriovoracaceae bacterium]|nr:hypothetical protein [Bacteriovoracaceae bacterium]